MGGPLPGAFPLTPGIGLPRLDLAQVGASLEEHTISAGESPSPGNVYKFISDSIELFSTRLDSPRKKP